MNVDMYLTILPEILIGNEVKLCGQVVGMLIVFIIVF